MSASENKKLLQHIYSELSKGNSSPFLEGLSDDVSWTIMGMTRWSKTYEGKQAILTELLGPLFAQFADQYTATAHRFIAEDDLVVVEVSGRVTTKSGKPYNNSYCYIFRLDGGKIQEVKEYLDTQLAVSVLGG
ncbi:MAG TPA: nuclear transport factor 2 family protein [Blastocatellia bacterium]|nr:nuclear transport factor 2 family protein [Blastocatellia bacterium]